MYTLFESLSANEMAANEIAKSHLTNIEYYKAQFIFPRSPVDKVSKQSWVYYSVTL